MVKQALGQELYYCIGHSPSVNGEEQFSICESIDEAKIEIKKYGNHHEYCSIEKGYENSDERTVVYNQKETKENV